MIRTPAMRAALLLALLAPAAAPAVARADGAWSTYLRMTHCPDLLALRDTVWIATGEAGLVRYLRSSGAFEGVTREPGGLASNSLAALALDRSGRLWVATTSHGVSRLSADGSKWDLVNAFDGLPSDSVTALLAQGDTVWIGTNRGLALWNGVKITGSIPDLGTPSPFRDDRITGLALAPDTLIVGTRDGVYLARISDRLATWTNIDNGLASTAITALSGESGTVFAVAGSTLHAWDPTGGAWTVPPGPSSPYDVRADFGRALAATPAGLWQWSGTRWDPVAESPAGDALQGGADPDGVVIAVQDSVLYDQQLPAWGRHVRDAPVGNDVQNLVADGRSVWMGTFAEGVGRFEAGRWRNWPATVSSGSNQDTTFINSSFAFMMTRDAAGRKWIANWGRAVERVDDSGEPFVFDHLLIDGQVPGNHTQVWASAVDDSGYLYIGGETCNCGNPVPLPVGIDVYRADGTYLTTWTSTNAALGDNQINALAIDSSHRLWAGSVGGGVHTALVESAPGRLVPPVFSAIGTTAHMHVWGIVPHGDSVWVLTDSNLLRYNRASLVQLSSLTTLQPQAPRGGVHPLEVTGDGRVWAGSSVGIRVFTPGQPAADITTANSPLADDEVRAIVAEPGTGVLWIGTAQGLNRYDPHWTPPPVPKVSTLHLTPFPNPLWQSALGLDVRLRGNATAYEGEIVGLDGRVLHRFSAAANGASIWDGRDRQGRAVPPGIYFVHARGGGREATARIAVLR